MSKMTQFERIKELSIEEMADEIQGECCFCLLLNEQTCNNTDCKDGALQWLKSEVRANE